MRVLFLSIRGVIRFPLTRSHSRSNRVTEQWRLAVDVGDGCKALLKTPQLMAPGIRRRIHKLFAENPHWRERRTELSRLYTDVPNAAIERGGGTDDRRVLRYKFFKARVVFLCPFRLQTHDDGAPHFDVRAPAVSPPRLAFWDVRTSDIRSTAHGTLRTRLNSCQHHAALTLRTARPFDRNHDRWFGASLSRPVMLR